VIEVSNLRKAFGPVVAVDGVSFRAEDGAITGLLGPNGAGKTTTLRMLYALIVPDAGRVRIDERDVAEDVIEARRRIGALPDARGIYPRLTGRENVRYFGRLHGLGGAELEKRIDELIDLLEMKDIADRRAQGFSQGERAKVAIARALVHGPRNVLLDEPTNGLDVMSTRSMRELIRRLKAQGKCVIFSSHVMQEVSALCDRIVVIAHGKVVADGAPDDIRRRTGKENLEEAFVAVIGSDKGLNE
jgi:sodium transport system ATP-binding protein